MVIYLILSIYYRTTRARAGSNSYHRSVHYFFYDFDTLVLEFQKDRDSIPELLIALYGRNLILEYGRSSIAGTK